MKVFALVVTIHLLLQLPILLNAAIKTEALGKIEYVQEPGTQKAIPKIYQDCSLWSAGYVTRFFWGRVTMVSFYKCSPKDPYPTVIRVIINIWLIPESMFKNSMLSALDRKKNELGVHEDELEVLKNIIANSFEGTLFYNAEFVIKSETVVDESNPSIHHEVMTVTRGGDKRVFRGVSRSLYNKLFETFKGEYVRTI